MIMKEMIYAFYCVNLAFNENSSRPQCNDIRYGVILCLSDKKIHS